MSNGMISIVVPVYNVEKYLERCVQTIIRQTYTNWQLVLVDDGSTDHSGSICDSLAIQDNRICVIHQKNGGISNARNTGLNNITGEYVIFFDPDDWVEDEILSRLHKSIISANADMVACDSNDVYCEKDGQYRVVRGNKWSKKGEQVLTGSSVYHEILLKSVTLWNKLFRREAILGITFNEKCTFGEDIDFLVNVLKNIRIAVITDYVGYNYFINRPGNVVSNSINDRYIELLHNTASVYKRLQYCPDRNIGVHRINLAINQVLEKIPIESYMDCKYKKYIQECKSLIWKPGFCNLISYLFDLRYNKYLRMRYILFMISPYTVLHRRAKRAKRVQSTDIGD